MKKKEKEMWKNIILLVLPIIFIILGLVLGFHIISGIDEDSEKAKACLTKAYEVYEFSHMNSPSYFFGDCFVNVYHYYETKRRCGLFGISCYESSETHTEVYKESRCFELKTGEQC